MTNQEIFDLMDRFERSKLQSMKLSCQDFSIELCRPEPAPVYAAPAVVAAPAAPAVSAAPVAAPAAAPAEEGPAITAPLVGTYYAASAPDQPPFVAVGDKVSKGQTVCLIEAMKMMNEITTPAPGIVVEVLAANGTQVEYDRPLFRVATAAGETH